MTIKDNIYTDKYQQTFAAIKVCAQGFGNVLQLRFLVVNEQRDMT